jgi:hypothetical protein
LKAVFAILLFSTTALGQTIGTHLPSPINKSEKFLFYLHGGVVTVLGNNAINQSVPEWGPYEYLNILDSLRSRGFNVISERRFEGVNDSVYANKMVSQIDSLFKAGVKPKNILVVGASAGWNITLQVSDKLKDKNMKYVIMGGCCCPIRIKGTLTLNYMVNSFPSLKPPTLMEHVTRFLKGERTFPGTPKLN